MPFALIVSHYYVHSALTLAGVLINLLFYLPWSLLCLPTLCHFFPLVQPLWPHLMILLIYHPILTTVSVSSNNIAILYALTLVLSMNCVPRNAEFPSCPSLRHVSVTAISCTYQWHQPVSILCIQAQCIKHSPVLLSIFQPLTSLHFKLSHLFSAFYFAMHFFLINLCQLSHHSFSPMHARIHTHMPF